MSVFNKNYSSFYDDLYVHKNYFSEFKLLQKIIHKYKKDSKNILELGCGTGSYTKFFLKNKFIITAVDQSRYMLIIAKKKNKSPNVNFVEKNILNFKSKAKKYDVVGAFFDVISYFKNKNQFKIFLKNSNNNLNKGGLLIFDFWNKDGVIKLKPENRSKFYKKKNYDLIKITNPKWLKRKDKVLVETKIFKFFKKTKKIIISDEKHEMLYFQLNSIKRELKINNFKFLKWFALNGKNKKINSCWSIMVIAKKIN